MNQKISLSGSPSITADIQLRDDVVFLVLATCKEDGRKVMETQGQIEKRKMIIEGLIPLSGPEAAKAAERIRAAQPDEPVSADE